MPMSAAAIFALAVFLVGIFLLYQGAERPEAGAKRNGLLETQVRINRQR